MTRKPALRIVAPEPAEAEPEPKVVRYTHLYRQGERNFCPGCGREHWLVGRVSAECGFCATAIDLADAVR